MQQKKYERQKTDVARQCVIALREMAGKISRSQHCSCEYVNSIDREACITLKIQLMTFARDVIIGKIY